jgi:hypothetical protein
VGVHALIWLGLGFRGQRVVRQRAGAGLAMLHTEWQLLVFLEKSGKRLQEWNLLGGRLMSMPKNGGWQLDNDVLSLMFKAYVLSLVLVAIVLLWTATDAWHHFVEHLVSGFVS